MWNNCVQALDVYCEQEMGGVRRKSKSVKKVESMVCVVDVGTYIYSSGIFCKELSRV